MRNQMQLEHSRAGMVLALVLVWLAVADSPALAQRSGGGRSERTFRWLKLPEAYRSKDKDADGQIGLYEWSRSDLATFRKLDLNGDGFLTPVELISGPSKSGTSTANASVSTSQTGTSGSSSSSTASSAAASGQSSPAETAFSLLDKDKNGTVSTDEWQRSLSVRPKFKKAGITPSLPLTKDEFVRAFQEVNSSSK